MTAHEEPQDAPGGAGEAEVLDVVVLAGGRGRRLGGVSKADLRLGRARLLDHILADLADWDDPRVPLGRIVAVAPDSVDVPSGVLRILEEPPGGGPSAGIAAAVAALGSGQLVAVLTCDAPRAARALPLLLSALGPDGAAARADGFTEYLLGVYRFGPLARRVQEERGARDVSARRLLGPLALRGVDVGGLGRDIDTWADLEGLRD
ncbi:MAG: molybdenum cofactor guanylyltransferase [Actinomycetota bacterium]